MNQSISLANYIDEWMNTYKAYSVRQSTFDRLLISIKALEGCTIASMPIGEITYNIYVHLYGDGFDEMYSALVPKGKEKTQTLATLRSHGRGRRTRTLNKGFGDPRVTITPCPYAHRVQRKRV